MMLIKIIKKENENGEIFRSIFFNGGICLCCDCNFYISGCFSFVSIKMNKNALTKWLAVHPNAVKIELSSGNNVITQKQLYARVISGEAAIFNEKAKYIVCADPGDIVLEVTYTYTRPGVLHKNVTTTWGPAKVELNVERGKRLFTKF